MRYKDCLKLLALINNIKGDDPRIDEARALIVREIAIFDQRRDRQNRTTDFELMEY